MTLVGNRGLPESESAEVEPSAVEGGCTVGGMEVQGKCLARRCSLQPKVFKSLLKGRQRYPCSGSTQEVILPARNDTRKESRLFYVRCWDYIVYNIHYLKQQVIFSFFFPSQ